MLRLRYSTARLLARFSDSPCLSLTLTIHRLGFYVHPLHVGVLVPDSASQAHPATLYAPRASSKCIFSFTPTAFSPTSAAPSKHRTNITNFSHPLWQSEGGPGDTSEAGRPSAPYRQAREPPGSPTASLEPSIISQQNTQTHSARLSRPHRYRLHPRSCSCASPLIRTLLALPPVGSRSS